MASYGSDVEDDEEDFNPAPEIDEDDVAPSKSASRRPAAEDDEDEVDAPTMTGNDDEDEEGGGADLDDRHHRELDMRREVNAQRDVEEIAKEFDEKYRRRQMQSTRRGGAGAVPLALPTVDDPSIWGCKCRPGKEREIIMAIQKRIDEKLRAGMGVQVYSAFERGPSGPQSGFLYVEADSKQAVVELIEGIQNVFMGSGQFSIPPKERDLAKVVEVSTNGLDCVVQLVPRLDYGLNDDANAAVDNKRKRGFFGKQTERPPAKLFNEAEAKKRHMKHLSMTGSGNQRAYTYKGEDYQNGFLIKEVKVNWVSTEKVNPKMEELQFFSIQNADGTETMDLMAVQAAQKAADSGSAFAAGENVEIYTGEQKGIRGTTVTVTGDILTLRVSEDLRKLFRDGDHVKVIGGSKYVDEVGLVTRIRDDKITLLCDSTQQEITVFSKDLKRAADSANVGADSNFDLYDFVQIE
ncbi:Transcription elongation factor SPT5 [Pyrenophora tritici-repentis]|nr:Transcription elongation factor SPT5 [Pyrenophora tritici-repentis]